MHAVGNDEDYVRSAIKGGFQELGFSDHSPWKYHTDFVSDIRMLPEELPEYVESIRALKEKYRNRISIRIGLECEYFPEYTHWLKEIIREYRLDYILLGTIITTPTKSFHTSDTTLPTGTCSTSIRKALLKEWRADYSPIWPTPTSLCAPIRNSIHIVPALAATSAGLRHD